METKSIFQSLAKEPDFMAILILILLLILNRYGKNRILIKSAIQPASDNNWGLLGTAPKLTREQIRTEPGYEHLSNEEVDNIIETNYQLSLIYYNNYKANISAFCIGEY